MLPAAQLHPVYWYVDSSVYRVAFAYTPFSEKVISAVPHFVVLRKASAFVSGNQRFIMLCYLLNNERMIGWGLSTIATYSYIQIYG